MPRFGKESGVEVTKGDVDGKDEGTKPEIEITGEGSGGARSVGAGREEGDSPDLSVNLERGLVLHVGVEDGSSDEEFDLDRDDMANLEQPRWFAVARYYSGRPVKARVMFSELSNAWGEVISRHLGDYRFLLEFSCEQALNFVLKGGPWKFKGDVLILVRYDGFSRLSEVSIESIPLWIRIYDMRVALMRSGLVSILAAKVGKVMEVGEAVKDFIRVRVDLDLADALKDGVRIKVEDMGIMEFEVKYEDVQHFCFWCGCIGHAVRECPDEDLDADGMRFGVELRTFPYQRAMGRQLAFQRSAPAAKRGIKFSVAQKEKVASFVASSSSQGGGYDQRAPRVDRVFGRVGGAAVMADGESTGANRPRSQVPKAREAEPMEEDKLDLTREKDQVDIVEGSEVPQRKEGNYTHSQNRVSGLYSFVGSRDGLKTGLSQDACPSGSAPLSRHDRQRDGKVKSGVPGQHKLKANSPRAKEIKEQKKSRQSLHPDLIVDTLHVLGKAETGGGWMHGGLAAGVE